MAVIALVPLVTALVSSAGYTGTIVGTVAIGAAAAVGSYVDATYTYPLLFHQKQANGPRLDDLRVETATEGSPYPFTVGSVRIGGEVIWSSDLIETSHGGGGGTHPKPKTFSYSVDVAIAFGCGRRTITKLWANGKVIYDRSITDDTRFDIRYEHLVTYPGSDTQNPDPTIESYKGSANTPAYRGTCYVVIKGLQLADFGGALPQIQALVEQDPSEDAHHTVSLLEASNAIMAYAGWNSSFYDFSSLPDVQVRGMVISGTSNLANAIEPLRMAYQLVIRESEGVLQVMGHNSVDTITIGDGDIGADQTQPQPPYSVKIQSQQDLPSQVDIRFLDVDHAYDAGQQTERSPIATTSNVQSIDVPLVMKPDEARKLAQVALWASYVESTVVTLRLPPKYMSLQENDRLLTDEIGQRNRTIRITELTRGWNGVVEVTGHFEQTATQSGLSPVYTPGPDEDGPAKITTPYVHILDIAPLTVDEVNTPGVYVAASRPTRTDKFRNVVIYGSPDGGSTYEDMGVTPDEATIGQVTATTLVENTPAFSPITPISDMAPYPILARDDVSTVTVQLYNGTLDSATDSAVKTGTNWMLVGDEIIGFVHAELVSTGVYTLSQLYRGLMNTEHACKSHSVGEKVVLLDESLLFVPIPIALRLTAIYFKAVPIYGDATYFDPFTRIWRAENVKDFRPHHILAYWDGGTTDLVLTWLAGSRYPKMALTLSGPADESSIKYGVEIYDSSVTFTTGSVPTAKRKLVVNGSDLPWHYTAAMQSADGISSTTGCKVLIYQIGSFVPKGRYVIITVDPAS